MARVISAEFNPETEKFALELDTAGIRPSLTWKEAKKLAPRYRGTDPLKMELCLKNKIYKEPKKEGKEMSNILQIKFKSVDGEDNYIPIKHRIRKALKELRETNPNFEKITKDMGSWKTVDAKGGMVKIPIHRKEATELHKDPDAWDQLETDIAEAIKMVDGVESFDDVLCDWMKE